MSNTPAPGARLRVLVDNPQGSVLRAGDVVEVVSTYAEELRRWADDFDSLPPATQTLAASVVAAEVETVIATDPAKHADSERELIRDILALAAESLNLEHVVIVRRVAVFAVDPAGVATASALDDDSLPGLPGWPLDPFYTEEV